MERCRIASDALSAEITANGAELCSLRDAAGREYLWQALPSWPRHAPVLFPIVGRLAHDTLRHQGVSYPLTQHGFARDRRFDWVARDARSCTLRLTDDAATRARYPFAFRFTVRYAIAGDTLGVTYTLDNPAEAPLPAAMGAHPAFRWPLADGVAKDAHTLTFERPEPAPIRRVAGGLLLAASEPSPVTGTILALRESLFTADAVILDRPASRWVRLQAPGTPMLELGWDGFRELGIWMKPGADFLCLEPWCGYASPVGWDGDFIDKPGLLIVPPGGSTEARYHVRLRS